MAEFPTENDLWGLSDEARQFITFVVTNMNRSYKPVMLLCLLDLADEQWRVSLDALSLRFLSFYQNREALGLVPEKPEGAMTDPAGMDLSAVKTTLLRAPIPAFATRGYLVRNGSIVSLRPDSLWSQAGADDISQFRTIAERAIAFYFDTTAH